VIETLAYIRYFAGYKYQLSLECTVAIQITGYEVECKYFTLYADGTLQILVLRLTQTSNHPAIIPAQSSSFSTC